LLRNYQQSGNYNGLFGVALSPLQPDTGRSFVQSFEGGKLHFTDGGQVSASDQSFVTISYQGAYCFGSPKFPRSHSLYLIVIVYVANKKAQATVVKIPDDQGGSTYDGWDADSEANDAAPAEGVPPDRIPPVAINIITEGLFAVVDSIFGLTDQVRGKPMSRTFKYADWFTLQPPDSLKFHDVTYNWDTDIMTDGDASYKAYFNLAKHAITS
jgi:hypothetical protein